MKKGMRSLVWLTDEDGKEYVCSLDDTDKKTFEELTEEEKRKCADVNQIVGTERW
ncbi:MAG: hypothetical protein V2I35_13055 [Desulfocapsaceae bacterium]|jgi:hypothetical protein|nr:hypothetical protein [Desulfocapsaceae bacterium]